MTLLFIDGFEGGPGNWKSAYTVLGTIQATGARTGNYCLASSATPAKFSIPASAKITLGFAYFATTPTTGGSSISLWSDGGTTQHLTLVLNPSTLFWELRRGSASGTLLATGTHAQEAAISRNHQVQATIADSGGTFIFKIDGVDEINFTGDTKNGGTATTIDAIQLLGNNGNSGTRMDDLWVCDGVDATLTGDARPNNGFLGDLKINVHDPVAAGDLTQWTPSAGANYTDVDEHPANTTDYVASSTALQKDLYAMSDLPSGVNTIYGVQVMAYAAKTDAGARGFKTVVKENSVVSPEASSHPLSTTFTQYNGPLLKVRPSDSAAWSAADVNAMQAGVECESA